MPVVTGEGNERDERKPLPHIVAEEIVREAQYEQPYGEAQLTDKMIVPLRERTLRQAAEIED